MALTDSYLNLITSQHRDKPKYIAMLSSLFRHTDDLFDAAIYFDYAFTVDEAQGVQEDIIGDIVGAKRTLKYNPEQGQYPVLDDGAYRSLIRSSIAKNQWKGNIEDLKRVWADVFGTGIVVQDNQDMSISVVVVGQFENIVKEMIKQNLIVPKVQGVRINYTFSEGPVFGYDLDTATIKGYDLADWETDQLAPAFTYDLEDEKKRLHGYDKGQFV